MKKKVLLVEDEEMLLEGYAKFIEKAGYEVVRAGDGYKGLDILETEKDEFCIFILDLMIPGIDGLEVLRLKEENKEKYGTAPVLVLTNMTSEKVIKEAFDLGAVSYLIKNDMPMEFLVEEVKKIVGS